MTRRWLVGLAVAVSVTAALVAVGVAKLTAGPPRNTATGLIPQEHPVGVIAYSPDGSVLAVAERYGDRPMVRLVRVPGAQSLAAFDAGSGVTTIAFSPDGKTLATAGFETLVRLWEVPSGRAIRTLGRPTQTRLVAFGPDGKTLAVVESSGTVRIWDLASGESTATNIGEPVGAAAFSAGLVATARKDGTVGLWELPSGRNTATRATDGHLVNALAFSPNGKTLAVAGTDKAIRLWDIASGRTTATLTGHAHQINTVTYSPDGATIASAEVSPGDPKFSFAPSVRLWNASTGRSKAVLVIGGADPSGATCWPEVTIDTELAYSPDGRTLAATCGSAVRLWNTGS